MDAVDRAPLSATERQALDQAHVMVRGLDGQIQLWTSGMVHLYGFPAVEAVGRISHQLLKTIFPAPLVEVERSLAAQGRWSGELIHHRSDGAVLRVASEWSLLLRDDGQPYAVLEVNTDITAQRHVEADRWRLAAIVENSQDAIIGKTLEGVVTSWNGAAETLFGYTASEMIGRPVSVLFPEDLLAEEAGILEQLRRGERIEHYETVRLRKDGTGVPVSLSISPIRNSEGVIVGASKIVRDLTDQKRIRERLDELQSELLHVARLNEIGQMASAFAHELNQPLSAISSYISGVRTLIEAGDLALAAEGCERAAQQVLRAGDVIRSLREFVGKGKRVRRVENLASVVEESARLGLVGAPSQGIRVSLAISPDAADAVLDKVQIQQVIVNLVRNAVEAMADGPQRDLTLSTARASDGRVEVIVSDTGPGLAEDIKARLFQPFATTKPNGMGVGLSLSRTIIEDHGGRIWAEDRPGGGTVFRFTLPAA